jgi:hypothetical protein
MGRRRDDSKAAGWHCWLANSATRPRRCRCTGRSEPSSSSRVVGRGQRGYEGIVHQLGEMGREGREQRRCLVG